MFSSYPKNFDGTRLRGSVEVEYNATKNGPRITSFKRYLPAGPLADGGVREKALLQFYTDPGGLRTVNAEDVIVT